MSEKTIGCRRTRFALVWMHLASEPLIALYTLIPFILRKDLHASLYQISLFISLRPVLAVFSFYWSAYLKEGKGRLIFNLVSASFLAFLPFLFFPWAGNFWFLLFASAIYQLFSRAAIPSLIEVLKRNIPKKPREGVYSLSFLLSFIESGILGILFGQLLDQQAIDWKMLFFTAAMIGLSGILFFSRLHVPTASSPHPPPVSSLLHPWKDAFRLINERQDFAHFQKAFMLGGSSLMLMAPALAAFYADVLHLSYTSLTTARFIFMALGVTGSIFFWKRGLSEIPLSRLCLWILLGFSLFPLVLLCAQWTTHFLYIAFFLYGIAQAGSHLIWNLSGTFFAGEGDSARYTRVNILMVGLRGAVVPFLGGVLCDLLGPIPILVLGAALSLFGVRYLVRLNKVSVPF